LELPICDVLYTKLYEEKDAKETLEALFLRPVKFEF
jgi:glycerol-3-phosphate dehydrogenase (NAD(P)+)